MKLLRLFESLPDSVAAALEIMKQDPQTIDVIEVDEI